MSLQHSGIIASIPILEWRGYERDRRMNTQFQERLNAVDAALLTPLVRQVLADTCAEVLDWSYVPLGRIRRILLEKRGSYLPIRFVG